MSIKHQYRFTIHKNKVFYDVSSYEEMNEAIYRHGCSQGAKGSYDYRQATGKAFEVYNEFFCSRYGNNPLLGIRNVTDTSLDPFNDGFDFGFTGIDNEPGKLQTKWKHNPQHKFTRSELGTFSSVLNEDDINRNNAVLFTNLRHAPQKDGGSIFHYGWDKGAQKQMRVFDRTAQEQLILRDPSFWDDFRKELENSCTYSCVEVPENEPHQDEMEEGSNRVIDGELSRGRIICATGGGKTLVEYRNVVRTLFKHNEKITIIVAPTRDLVDQHFTTFHDYGLFHRGVQAVNFKSGSEPPRDDEGMDYPFAQTCNIDGIVPYLGNDQKTHICSTYKSFPVLIEALKEMGIEADLIIFDEFQHLVSQKVNDFGVSNMRDFLLNLPAKRILYYSASQKRGRVLSSFDEDVFGPVLADISYKRLRESGVLVPKLQVIPVRVNPSRITGLRQDIKEQTRIFNNVDLEDAIIEAAGMIVAYQHALTRNSGANMITWGKKVSHIQAISSSEAVRKYLEGITFRLIHADISARERTFHYEEIRNTVNNILLQHSCVSEGVNVVNLDTAYVARRLNTIAMQQGPGGRPTRAHPDDRIRFKRGELSIDNPEGWKKYSSTVYVLVETDEDETFKDFMVDLIQKLQFAGLAEDDYEFLDLNEERHGDDSTRTDWMPDIELLGDIEYESLESVVKQARLEIEEEEKHVELNFERERAKAKFENASVEDILSFLAD